MKPQTHHSWKKYSYLAKNYRVEHSPKKSKRSEKLRKRFLWLDKAVRTFPFGNNWRALRIARIIISHLVDGNCSALRLLFRLVTYDIVTITLLQLREQSSENFCSNKIFEFHWINSFATWNGNTTNEFCRVKIQAQSKIKLFDTFVICFQICRLNLKLINDETCVQLFSNHTHISFSPKVMTPLWFFIFKKRMTNETWPHRIRSRGQQFFKPPEKGLF